MTKCTLQILQELQKPRCLLPASSIQKLASMHGISLILIQLLAQAINGACFLNELLPCLRVEDSISLLHIH